MSENAHEALEAFPEFITEYRGEIFVKVSNCYAYVGGPVDGYEARLATAVVGSIPSRDTAGLSLR